MLPSRHRLRRSTEFSAVLRGGRRAGRDTMVLHVLLPTASVGNDLPATRFGLVVGRGVGNSVVRHQVSRRIRALLAQRVDRFPAGADVVVRARPSAARAASSALARDLDASLAAILQRRAPMPARASR